VNVKPGGILETALYCQDLEAAKAFYSQIMGLDLIGYREGRHVFFQCGHGVLLLFNPEHTRRIETSVDGVPIPLHGTEGAGHLAFRVTPEEIVDWLKRLTERGIAVEADVAWPRGGRSIYFRDPGGNSIEMATPDIWSL
jgi:catechol 2,3-dioxygenase-like lactoylglutathione lyase family enzyme